jgi:hypothetical protein
MAEPGQWKDLCQASNDSFIKECHGIENLWPTFDPKELLHNFYKPETAFAEPGLASTK